MVCTNICSGSKRVFISLIILSLIALFSLFFNLKKTSYRFNFVFPWFFWTFISFWFSQFLSTSIKIFDTSWFTIILGCVCFKKTHNFMCNTTHCFWWTREYSKLTNLQRDFCKQPLLHHFFFFKFIHIIGLKNISSSLLILFLYPLISYLLIL